MQSKKLQRGKECTFRLGPREILVVATGAQGWEGRAQEHRH